MGRHLTIHSTNYLFYSVVRNLCLCNFLSLNIRVIAFFFKLTSSNLNIMFVTLLTVNNITFEFIFSKQIFCIFDQFWLLYSSVERRSISLIDKNSFQFTCCLLKPDMKIMVMLILFLLYFFVLFNRSNDSCLLCCGAVRSRDSGR